MNGGLFKDDIGCPRFSRTSRAYLLRAGELDWKTINPDIFGSMIQAVADEDERGELGMHYTSVPNIQKVLDPLFLDDLREQLEAAGTNKRKLFNLRRRLSRIRVFDPACGSGNFLVISYIRMREIEDEIMRRRGEALTRSAISLTQFYGIEIKSFAAEIARLSLLIAEFQCDVRFIGQAEARALVLPLHATGNILTGNALRIDWTEVCPPMTTSVEEHDLGGPTGRLALEVNGEHEEWETYLCGNPPYAGLSSQNTEQKADLEHIFSGASRYWKSFDYVFGWFWKARNYGRKTCSAAAFVATNSICQGQQVPMFWPLILNRDCGIGFAHTSFKWKNLVANNAGVTVVIVGIGPRNKAKPRIFNHDMSSEVTEARVENINAYLVPGPDTYVDALSKPPSGRPTMYWGNKPTDGGNLIMDPEEARAVKAVRPAAAGFLRPFYGSNELIIGQPRTCIWVEDIEAAVANEIPELSQRFDAVRRFRSESKARETRPAAAYPHRFRQVQGHPGKQAIIVPIHTSESRDYLPVGLLPRGAIVSNAAYAIYEASVLNISLIASRLHLVWIATTCGKLETRFRYSNTLGWNTFPVPKLDISIRDRFGDPVRPREWFVAPLPAIQDAVAKIQNGSLHHYEYRPSQAALVLRS